MLILVTLTPRYETKGPWNESVKVRDVKGKGSTGWPFPFVPYLHKLSFLTVPLLHILVSHDLITCLWFFGRALIHKKEVPQE